MTLCTCAGDRTTTGSQFSPSSVWLPGIKLQSSDLAASSFGLSFCSSRSLRATFFSLSFVQLAGANTAILWLLFWCLRQHVHDLNSGFSFLHLPSGAVVLSVQHQAGLVQLYFLDCNKPNIKLPAEGCALLALSLLTTLHSCDYYPPPEQLHHPNQKPRVSSIGFIPVSRQLLTTHSPCCA